MDVDHDLDAKLSAPLHCLIPDIKAILDLTALHALHRQFRIGVLVDLRRCRIGIAVLPLQQNFSGHGNTQKVESMVGDLAQHIVHILRPNAVEYLTPHVIAKPVAASDPNRIAIPVHDFSVVVNVQPVVVVGIRRCSSAGNAGSRRHQQRCRQKHRQHKSAKK